ncbi:LysR family transcriptional regulator [Archangium violaceum]|uniref:LysR family transcriptional regulator n=1 Tax=Archangium violaceum TaxID=83451 RepID=UPI0031B81201
MGRSPAAVTRAIAFLEGHVGVQLLHRTTPSTRWCWTVFSCQGRAACASSLCRRPRKQRWCGC